MIVVVVRLQLPLNNEAVLLCVNSYSTTHIQKHICIYIYRERDLYTYTGVHVNTYVKLLMYWVFGGSMQSLNRVCFGAPIVFLRGVVEQSC